MRIPWSVPTVSDATKLGAVRAITANSAWESPGACLYELLYQAVITENFANLSAWSETDSGTNVNLSGGEVSMNGSNNYTANGLSYTSGVTAARGYFEVKVKSVTAAAIAYFGLNSSNTLAVTYAAPNWRPGSTLVMYAYRGNTAYTTGATYTADTWYTLRIYLCLGPEGNLDTVRLTIQGGAEFASETIMETWKTAALAATLYPQLMRYTNNATNLTVWKEFRWYSGYATDGPYLTYVADAGAGKTFGGFDPTNLAAVGSWATTNAKFQYSYDDGTPAYNGSWLTMAQLNAETALTTSKRYIRLLVQANSDGATQQYIGEVNADDATTLPAGGGASESSASESSLSESSASESSLSESSASESSASESSTDMVVDDSESSASESSASESTASTSSESTSSSTSSTSSSTSGGSSSSSSESGPGDFTVNEYEDFLRDEGDQVTIERKTLTVTDTGARVPAWSTVDTVYASIQPANSNDRAPYERRGLFVSHKVFIAEDPGVTEGDRIGRGSTIKYVIHGVKDVMDRGELFVLYCEEMKS